MEDLVIKELLPTCTSCNSTSILMNKDNIICSNCSFVSPNPFKTIAINKCRNKTIHLNNVLKNIDTMNYNQIEKILDVITEIIKKNNIKLENVDITYFSELLKKKGIKGYILHIQLYNCFLKKNSKLTNNNIDQITAVFDEFLKYIFTYNPTLCNSSISYHQILYNICKYLGINKNLKPSNTKCKNVELNNVFEKYINTLCDDYYKKKKINTKESFALFPNLNKFPNKYYKDEI